ncbi:hypothetical protein PITCH_A1020023 [uncultured Desulfobacterium sp.]|uniref:Fibronectin type-III domain-containing protein n=1 Tax=uncultured Desulfobacterium sp. TaxID=201089 RepID=A0A445MQR2_9BACT|nr:hypothetical protein PITCH_A1020023 [uncultured Desulfobacterium sp.]
MKHKTNILPQLFAILLIPVLSFIITITAFSSYADCAQVTLAWNSVAESTGYKIYYGSASRAYNAPVDVGNNTSHTLDLASGDYFFAVTAYNGYGESTYSEEAICSIAAPPVAFSVTATAGQNGSITPTGAVSVIQGSSQTFTITPATNYHVSNVLVDGSSVGAVTSYTFSSVTANHTISATFAIDTYTITASAGSNGSISPSGSVTVNKTASQTFTITPATNYHVSNVLVDGVSVGPVTTYTFSNVIQAHTVAATFSIDTHTIKSSSGTNGGVFPAGDIPVNHGSNQSFAISPAQNYHVLDVIVDGVSVGALSSYTFSSVTTDHTISASFAIDTHTITTLAGENGSINPNGPVTVNHGETKQFIIAPNENYHVSDVLVDGTSVGAINSYIFENITTSHTIAASFAHDNRPPIADAGPDQKADENTTVTLNGANSTDIDENDSIVSYAWLQVSGQAVTLSSPEKAQTTFTAPSVDPEGAALMFQLTVTDSKGLTASDSCIVNVCSVNITPIADAGPDQTLKEGDSVILDGSGSSDPDNDTITYLWEQVSGPQVSLSSSSAVKPTFSSGDVGPDGASYTFQLTVTDSGGLKATDTCIVNISYVNIPPVANAGPDQSAVKANVTTLDGSGSSDVDNNITSYRWTQLSGAPVTLSDSSAIKPTFTVPDVGLNGDSLVFQLTVTDNGGLENSDTCTVNVSAIKPPVPDIKANDQDGPITVAKGSRLRISVSLNPGDYAGQKVDWWITANTPGNIWNSYIWGRRLWVSGIRVSYQGALTTVSRTVLDSKKLPAGDYTFYFAIDNNMDKIADSTWSDSVTVHIQ